MANRQKATLRNKLNNLATERNCEPIDLVLEALLSEQSIEGASAKLGVTRNAINYHLIQHGYKIVNTLTVEKK